MKRLTLLLLLLSSTLVLAQNGTIDTITVGVGDGAAYSVYLKGSGNLQYTEVLFDDPPRVALDFPNIKNKFTTRNFEPKDNPFVRLIRTMDYYKGNQKVSRIIVEMKSPLKHWVKRIPEGLALQLDNSQSANSNTAQVSSPVSSEPANPAPEEDPKTTPVNNTPPANSSNLPVAPQPVTSTGAVPPNLDVQIGSEDLLDIAVFELPQFSVQGARVAGDGTITMPLVGSIEVRGLTTKQVEDKIASALEAKYVNNANVSVTIKEYKSRQVSLLGAVQKPGAYYIVSPRTLLQLISEAGGLTAEAGAKCYIFRQGKSKVEIDLRDLMNNGNQDLNVPVLPGDVVNIPAESKVVIYVLGAVRTPGAIEMTTSMPITLLAAIARAGGPTEQASQGSIQIKRKGPDGRETVIKANLKDIIKGKAQDIKLNPGDVVNVPESFF